MLLLPVQDTVKAGILRYNNNSITGTSYERFKIKYENLDWIYGTNSIASALWTGLAQSGTGTI